MIKFKKKMNYLKGFILYALLCVFAFLPFMSLNIYAWSVDSNGNLVSDNILTFQDGSFNGLGVTYQCLDNKIYLSGTASSTGPLWVSVNYVPGTYTFQSFNDFTMSLAVSLRYGYDRTLARLDYDSLNSSITFATSYDITILAISVYSGVNYDNVVLTPSLIVGSTPLTSYEPYGVTYYSENNMDKITHVNFGAFAFCDLISVRYYNPNNLIWYDYKSFNNVYDFVQEKYVSFRNQSLTITDYTLIFVELGGDSSWRYQIYVHFPSNAIRVNDYNVWTFTGANNVDLDTYAGSGYHSSNVDTLTLTSEGFSSSDYLKYIYYTRISPDIATNWGSFGTPNSSIQYNQGFDDGYEKGKDDGFDSGFTDGKDEGYTMGYNEGYRDGTTEDFTTNGFKTLIGSIFNYPINFIRSVFNFEFMGINISSIVFFVLSIGIVIFVIKRFKK